MIDPFGRKINYLRVSVTDRCDFRCVYCMAEDMIFMPKKELLTLDEIERLCMVFIEKGVQKIRLTGGEPLVRRNIMQLFARLSSYLQSGMLKELTLTTNGSQLYKYANHLTSCGVKRINVSLDTLDTEKFSRITRCGRLEQVINSIEVAKKAGLHIKINTVVLKGDNENEIPNMIEWAHGKGMDITLIETMPLGETGKDRSDQYLPLSIVRQNLSQDYTLIDIDYKTGGPARYVKVKETGGLLGFITPLTHNFCENCNRVRVACDGTLYMCLGQDDAVDLRKPLRASKNNELLSQTIDEAISRKPKGHDFVIDRTKIFRHMSVTGG